jgi:carboxymethylenebutenolidase
MGAYIARPAGSHAYPGVIVGFELFGVTKYIRRMTDRIAALGYTVIAPDFFHRSDPDVELNADDEGRKHGFTLLHQLTREQALQDVQVTIEYLRNEHQAATIGMVGFSVGGHIAYLAATQFDLAATAVFYPGWLPVQDIPLSQPTPTLELTPGIAKRGGHLLFLVGEQDALIPSDQQKQIAAELLNADVKHEMIVYSDTPHGFFCDERDSYHKQSADDAWRRVRELLAAELH